MTWCLTSEKVARYIEIVQWKFSQLGWERPRHGVQCETQQAQIRQASDFSGYASINEVILHC